MKSPDISIIIPTKNGGHDIEKCLSGVFHQETDYSFEVIIIDSGSSDDTVQVVKKFPVTLVAMKPEDFNHGKVRNLGGRLAQGRYIVYLTQDAYPANEHWLQNLARNLEKDGKVAGVYSRQLPKPDCNLLEVKRISKAFGPIRQIKNRDGIREGAHFKEVSNLTQLIQFSNVSSCLRKNIWAKISFNDNSIFGEDQEWAKEILEAGYSIVYEPQSVVYHSHNDSLKRQFKRSFDCAVSFKVIKNIKVNPFLIPILAFYNSYRNYGFIKESTMNFLVQIKWLMYSIAEYFVINLARWLGIHHEYLPKSIKRRVTLVPYRW